MPFLLSLANKSYKHDQPSPKLMDANQFTREYRWVVRLAFDADETDLVYLTSHSDAALPAGATAIHNVIKDIPERSQTINLGISQVGGLTVSVVDYQGTVSALLMSKLQGLNSLRNRILRVYEGETGDGEGVLADDWEAYENASTYIVRNITYQKGVISIECSDIQRDLNVDIMDLWQSNLTATVQETDTTIPVVSTATLETLMHGGGFTDAPNQEVAYIRIPHPDGDEFVRCPVGSITATALNNVTRGVLGTVARTHYVDATKLDKHKTQVTELVYMEYTLPQMLFLLMTGEHLFGSGNVPSTWTGSLPRSMIQEEDFIEIGRDIFTPGDDTKGLILRFIGESKQNLKQFIEQQIYDLGFYSPIYNNGKIGLKRRANLLNDAPEDISIDSDYIDESASMLVKTDMDSVINLIKVNWNYDAVVNRFTRNVTLVDETSQNIYDETRLRVFNFRGLHGARHTSETIKSIFSFIRDRYSSAPYIREIKGTAVAVADK